MEQQRQDEDVYEVPRMELESVVGFNGRVKDGLKVHPDRQHIIYPLGCSLVIEDISTQKTSLLWGHTGDVTCVAISNRNGELLASGQETHMGFKAIAIVWDYRSQQACYKLDLHKVNVQALVFSPNDLYLASLGGCDDGSVVIWNMANGEAICGSPAQVDSAGNTLCISFSKTRDNVFVTGGKSTLRVWELDVENRKIRPSEVIPQINRTVECIQMDDKDPSHPFFFCGTSTGDILAINMNSKRFQFKAPEKNNFENGVTALAHLKNNNFLVGTGCGKLYELRFPIPTDGKKPAKPEKIRCWQDETVKSSQNAAITSITLRGAGHQFFVGTANARIYKFGYESSTKGGPLSFDCCELIKTCHSECVRDVVFPPGTSDLILTCQKDHIRIWAVKQMKELKRHVVPNMTCNAIALACDGEAIVSAWDDGKIRVFGFEGKSSNIKQRASLSAAHNKGVTAVACTKNAEHCYRGDWNFNIVSGGGEGQVRIWGFQYNGRDPPTHQLQDTLKEHKGAVSDIKIRTDDRECISASADGTCIIWNLEKRVRSQIFFANTLFKCVSYNKEENQIIASGTDRKIGYWDTHDGSEIRQVEGAKTGAVNAMDLSPDGQFFVTGGNDRLLKVWTYNNAEVVAVGMGHGGTIMRVKICPQMKRITSVSEDGAILVWKFPF